MSIISLMITILSIVFWLFRLVVCVAETLELDFFCKSLNLTLEIGVLFLTVPCIMFVFKRNLIGAASYMALYISYFGTALYNTLNQVNPEQGLNVTGTVDLVFAISGIVLGVLTFIDVLINKNRASLVGGSSKTTDWYYKDSKYDRQYDERADRNQYRNY